MFPEKISDTKYKYCEIYYKNHNTIPTTILSSYRIYDYFYGYWHVDIDRVYFDHFTGIFMPQIIGNGKSSLQIDWIAIWN